MTQQTATEATTTATAAAQDAGQPAGSEAPVEQELLIEEISIDGMCGVY
jgi:mycofactocin precursor